MAASRMPSGAGSQVPNRPASSPPESARPVGIVDMVTPTLTLTATHLGGGSAAQTEISFTAGDPFLDMSNLILPCAPNTWQTSTYEADQTRVDGISTTCRIPGHELNPITAQVCDLAGHCASDSVTLSPSPQVASVAILTPTHNVTIGSNNPVIPIGGAAYDTNGIETVALQINGVDFDTVAMGGGLTDTLWSKTPVPCSGRWMLPQRTA